jgi:tetratricopeptide (TPR) repeat protein
MKLAMVARVRHAWPAVALCGWLVAAAGATAKTHAVQPPAAQAPAAPGPSSVSDLARSWDHVNFEIPNPNAQIAAAEALASQAQAVARSHPGEPGPLIWEAAALLAKADARHDLASLGLAKQARRLLEQAIAEGASGEEGAFAHAVLGELYGETPGFPLGFGDRSKARAEFAKALALAPDNIDVNVLYADFLLDQKDSQGALEAAQHALNAPPRRARRRRAARLARPGSRLIRAALGLGPVSSRQRPPSPRPRAAPRRAPRPYPSRPLSPFAWDFYDSPARTFGHARREINPAA